MIAAVTDPVTGEPIAGIDRFGNEVALKPSEKRGAKPSPVPPMTEEERLAARAVVRERAKEAESASAEWYRLRQIIQASNGVKELLADDHANRIEPIQAELRKLDSELVDAIKARAPTTAIEVARTKAQAKLRGENDALNSAVADVEMENVALQQQCNELAVKAAFLGRRRDELLKLASAPLKLQYDLCCSRERWARSRATAAETLHARQQTPYTIAERDEARGEVERTSQAAAIALQELLDE